MSQLHSSTSQAMTDLMQSGVTFPNTADDVSIPSDFSSIPDQGQGNIGEQMGQLAAYLSFLEFKFATAEVEYETWQNAYEFEKKRTLLTLEPDRKDIMEARVGERLSSQQSNVMAKYAEMRLLKALLDGKKRIADGLSRELSRRSLILQMQRGGLQ